MERQGSRRRSAVRCSPAAHHADPPCPAFPTRWLGSRPPADRVPRGARLVRAATPRVGTMASLLERGLRRVRRIFWRTEMERSHVRWLVDRGDEPRRFDYALDSGAIVLDVGGYEGRWAEGVLARFGCVVHVFEPVPEYAAAIEARLAGKGRVFVHRFGLAGAHGETDFALSADASSAFRRGGERRTVKMRAAADVFDQLGLERVDLMKINIEGGEYELLEHLIARGLTPRIRHLQIQFHDFMPGAARRMRE